MRALSRAPGTCSCTPDFKTRVIGRWLKAPDASPTNLRHRRPGRRHRRTAHGDPGRDRLMDITVSDPDGTLRWYIEAKERAIDVPNLVDRIGAYSREGVEVNAPDRGNDALRKAKYLIWYRPLYFSVNVIGLRRDFQVAHRAGYQFVLIDDMVPLA